MTETEVLVNVEQGQLRGKVENDYAGRRFYSFMGIPYAQPPLGELRFKAPQPPVSWTGTKDATKEPSECYACHMITFEIIGAEDCLYLNVYTPRLPQSGTQNAALLPVMFWIHGGAFLHGSSKREFYSPEFLMEHDIVLVTINYRLGVLGFLSLDDPSLEVPGNAGLKDMVMALQWVQKNIAQFCGDSRNVTIFGESAGGAAVEYLTLSPLAKGLFHRAIIHSGSALCPWASGKTTLEALSNALEVRSNNAAEVLGILRKLPVEELLKVQLKLPTTVRAEPLCFGPVVENSETPGAFLTDSPLDILNSRKYIQVPLLFLYNKDEGILFDIFMVKFGLPSVHSNFEDYVPRCLKLKEDDKEFRALAEEIRGFYYGDKKPSSETKREFYNLETDFVFLNAIYNTIRTRLTTSNEPIYFCRFSLDAGLNFYKKANNVTHLKGTCHVDELGYLFKSFTTPTNISPDSIEDKTVKRLTKMWTNFAKYGSPIQENDSLTNIEWKPVEADKLHYLEIDEELSTGVNPDYDRISFWDDVYKKYGGQDNRIFNFNRL